MTVCTALNTTGYFVLSMSVFPLSRSQMSQEKSPADKFFKFVEHFISRIVVKNAMHYQLNV